MRGQNICEDKNLGEGTEDRSEEVCLGILEKND